MKDDIAPKFRISFSYQNDKFQHVVEVGVFWLMFDI